MVGVSLVRMDGLMIGTGEGSLVGLSMGLTFGSQLDFPNPGAHLHSMLRKAPLGLWFGSDVVWGVGISCIPPSGDFITPQTNSVRNFQHQEFLNLSLSPN